MSLLMSSYCFTDKDLGLSPDISKFDHYDFYYDLEELQRPTDPSMMDGNFIPNIQSPT
jgi:hypothetical protein